MNTVTIIVIQVKSIFLVFSFPIISITLFTLIYHYKIIWMDCIGSVIQKLKLLFFKLLHKAMKIDEKNLEVQTSKIGLERPPKDALTIRLSAMCNAKDQMVDNRLFDRGCLQQGRLCIEKKKKIKIEGRGGGYL